MFDKEELEDFCETSKRQFDEIVELQPITDLYIHKRGFPTIILRAPNPS